MDADEFDDRIIRPARATYRLALMSGWTIEEAGDLTAWRNGIRPVQHWTLHEVYVLDFLRWRLERAGIGGPDDE